MSDKNRWIGSICWFFASHWSYEWIPYHHCTRRDDFHSQSELLVCVCVSNGKVFVINLIPNEDVNIEEVVSNRFLCLLFSVSSRLKPVYEAEKFRTICYKLKTSSFSSDSNSKMLLLYSHSVLLMCLHCVIINQKIVFYVSIELNVWFLSFPLYTWCKSRCVPIIKTSIFDKQTSGKQQVSKTVKIETHKSSSATHFFYPPSPTEYCFGFGREGERARARKKGSVEFLWFLPIRNQAKANYTLHCYSPFTQKHTPTKRIGAKWVAKFQQQHLHGFC